MENMDKKDECGNCEQCCQKCGQCGSGCHHGGMNGHGYCWGHYGRHHYLLGVALRILVVILIFWAGYALGQLVGIMRADYGGWHGYGAGYNMMQDGGYGMMRGPGYYYFQTTPNGAAAGAQSGSKAPAPAVKQ